MIMSLDTDILLLDDSLEFHDFSVGITYNSEKFNAIISQNIFFPCSLCSLLLEL